jgi:hypothetical protein
MPDPTWTWLYTRGRESIRVVADATQVVVYGPGAHEQSQPCDGEDDALLRQKLIEQRLILGGWTLDRLITDRRSGRERREDDARPATERRRSHEDHQE